MCTITYTTAAEATAQRITRYMCKPAAQYEPRLRNYYTMTLCGHPKEKHTYIKSYINS